MVGTWRRAATHSSRTLQVVRQLFLSDHSGSGTTLNGHCPPPENLQARVAIGLFPIMRNIKRSSLKLRSPYSVRFNGSGKGPLWSLCTYGSLMSQILAFLAGKRHVQSPGRGQWVGLCRILIGAKNGPDVKISPLAKSSASASPRTDTGSRSQRMALQTAWSCLLRFVLCRPTQRRPFHINLYALLSF